MVKTQTRREWMKTAIKAAGSIALFTPLPSPAVSDKDELERIIVMDHARWEEGHYGGWRHRGRCFRH